ncbi:MAG: DUF934 domain-containing protein [Endozoicomonas sp.]
MEEKVLPEGNLLLPASSFQQAVEVNRHHNGVVGLWFDCDDEPENCAEALHQFEVIAVHFPIFSDGRGLSIARLLKERYQYQGEIRAVGDVLVDQLFYMARCGFNSFLLREDQNPAYALKALDTFSSTYQSGAYSGETVLHFRHGL